jgi:hypothetical protein
MKLVGSELKTWSESKVVKASQSESKQQIEASQSESKQQIEASQSESRKLKWVKASWSELNVEASQWKPKRVNPSW